MTSGLSTSTYRTLSDTELLSSLSAARGRSDIIDELCTRLQLKQKESIVAYQINCPVCAAKLELLTEDPNCVIK